MAKPGNVTIEITPDISKLEAGFKAMAESFEELARLAAALAGPSIAALTRTSIAALTRAVEEE